MKGGDKDKEKDKEKGKEKGKEKDEDEDRDTDSTRKHAHAYAVEEIPSGFANGCFESDMEPSLHKEKGDQPRRVFLHNFLSVDYIRRFAWFYITKPAL
jgi:hypothetical protein